VLTKGGYLLRRLSYEFPSCRLGNLLRLTLPRFFSLQGHAHTHILAMSAYEKDGEDNNVAGVPTSMCPEGSVPLHDLCERCRELFDNWSLLDRGVTGLVLKNSHERKIGTPVQLSRSQEFCHFCAMVFSRIKDDKDLDPNKSLTLDVHSMDIKHMCFLLSIGNGEDLRDIGLYLTWYKCKMRSG
jgi:hypothetical protein